MNSLAKHVIICGTVFESKQKAPFVTADCSILGALEYDVQTDMVKCHVCGKWQGTLAKHIGLEHGMSGSEYRRAYGLRNSGPKTMLMGAKTAQRMELALLKSLQEKPRGIKRHRTAVVMGRAGVEAKRKTGKKVGGGVSPEVLNLWRACRKQILARIAELGKTLGRTPTQLELLQAGMSTSSLRNAFGTVSKAVTLAGLQPRTGRGTKVEKIA